MLSRQGTGGGLRMRYRLMDMPMQFVNAPFVEQADQLSCSRWPIALTAVH
jgi:hypothetical protein